MTLYSRTGNGKLLRYLFRKKNNDSFQSEIKYEGMQKYIRPNLEVNDLNSSNILAIPSMYCWVQHSTSLIKFLESL